MRPSRRDLAAGVLPLALALAMGQAVQAQCTGFALSQSTSASIVPGTIDVGNHCDDCVTSNVALPFPVSIYGVSYSAVNLSSNGAALFTSASNSYTNSCLTNDTMGVAIFPHWDDLRTDGTGNGIFTSVSGSAPTRVFNIEWRTIYYGTTNPANFQIRLFEDNSRVEMIFATVSQGGASATVGIQNGVLSPTQFLCNSAGLASGLRLNFTCTNDPLPPQGVAASSPSSVYACGTPTNSLLTVQVAPGASPPSTGLTVAADLTSIGGSATQTFFNNGTNGDVTANDNIFSYRATIPASITPGTKTMVFTIRDDQGRTGSGGFGINVNPCPTAGPDVYIGDLTDVANYGATGTITAFAVGTNACNYGDLPVQWLASVNQHPVIAQNMYRLKNGRFEQLGQSWLKHGFSSTNSGFCGQCQQPPLGGQQLGISCSDAYGSGLNGSQGGLGPRSQVNPTTGFYPYPFTAPGASDPTISRRLQVFTADIAPATNPNARYFVDALYITADDARWTNAGLPATNGLNNASYREITNVNNPAPTLTGAFQRFKPGIHAWKDVDPSVSLVTADYMDTSLVPAGIVARFWVAGKAFDNGNGTWHYEYAVYNHNADRAASAFSIPTGPGVVVSNLEFHGVFAHSGEPYPNTAANPDNWLASVAGLRAAWRTPEAFSGNGDNANALRWGTMYNFRFDANVAPVANGSGSITLFKPGTPTSINATGLPVPGRGQCVADFDDGTATGRPDGGVTIDDLLYYLAIFESGIAAADIDDGSSTGTPDGGVTIDDLLYFLLRFEAGC